ncbi:right-handed parallel beta-helix repeat-containing protein [Pedobacter sp. L105]|uniref:right-handed parallel beta-helix repeat-containing protein n=1 Tax=Pedobacter sp. L105 TaxID=1641871 RepID=UPI00131B5BAB|nr:right-handed parallel beta-helix repeat-containing protein [Pedobacter sp. L105]
MKKFFIIPLLFVVLCGCEKSAVNPEQDNLSKLAGKKTIAITGLNYYVNTQTGNDANAGTVATSPLKTIQAGLNKTAEGVAATVWVAGGTYNERLNWPHSGASGAPITLTNYDSGVVIVDGSTTTASTQNSLITVTSKSYLRINNIRFTNNIRAGAFGIYIVGSGTDVQVTSCKVYNVGWTTSPTTIPTSTDNANPLTVVGTGATSYSQVYIGSNEIYNCNTGYSEGLTLSGNVENFLIESNTVHDIPNIGIDMTGHYSWTGAPAAVNYARSGNVKHNTVYNCVSQVATSGGIYVDGGANINIEGNTSYANGAGITVGCENNNFNADNINVRDNLIYNNKGGGILIGSNQPAGKVTNSTVSNNTFFQNFSDGGYGGEILIQNTDHLSFINNIIQSRNDMEVIALLNYTSTNLTMNYNNYYSASGSASTVSFDWGGINGQWYGSLAAFTAATGLEANSTYALPGFTSPSLPTPNLHLLSTATACINKGLPGFTAATDELDIDSQTRVQHSRVDIGADETSY